jgi:hypothetical protein
MVVLTIAVVWVGVSVVAAVLFNRLVHFSESRPADLGMSRSAARNRIVLRGGRSVYNRARLSRHTALYMEAAAGKYSAQYAVRRASWRSN